jgi:hypothetical protein
MKRWPLYVAIAYVILLFAALSAAPTAPGVSASGATLVRYYRDHGSALRVSGWLLAWSTVPLVLLFAALRTHLRGLGRDVMLLGAAGVVVAGTVFAWLALGLALHPNTLDPGVARTVTDISLYFGPLLTVLIVVMIAPIGIAAWRNDGFPKWLAWVTLVFVIEQSIETITIFGKHGFIEPGGAMNLRLGAGLYLVWLICAGAAVAAP